MAKTISEGWVGCYHVMCCKKVILVWECIQVSFEDVGLIYDIQICVYNA